MTELIRGALGANIKLETVLADDGTDYAEHAVPVPDGAVF